MIKTFIYLFFFALAFLGGWISRSLYVTDEKESINIVQEIIQKPLEKYDFDKLSLESVSTGKLSIKEQIKKDKKYNSYKFEFVFNPNLDGKSRKMTTGQINIPTSETDPSKNYPLIIMFRGYVNQENYQTGDGTRRGAEYFANNGFITLAPDFLGYGGSDEESGNIFETRFQTYVTSLSLLKTVEELSKNPDLISGTNSVVSIVENYNSIFIWGHSNGGQIAITLLELSGKNYPATLWAPVTKPFPYSVLYYTDDSVDGGKFIRAELSKFEAVYNADKYSLRSYVDKINAPLQLHQGLNDDAIPVDWTREFVEELKGKEKEVVLYEYEGTDHNMRPLWDEVAERDLNFFNKYLN